MVNTGQPSRGCGVCRRRRIKCDEQQPACTYCLKTSQQCVYKNAFDVAWRDQTLVAQKHVQRRERASARQRSQAISATSSYPQTDNSTTVYFTTELSPRLVESPETQALNFFFSTYARPPVLPDERHGFMEYVAPQFFASKSGSTIHMSTLSLASIMFTAWKSKNPDSVMSRISYGNAITAMKSQIMDANMCNNNEILTSVLLLQMYETLLSNVKQITPPNFHLHGALSIIKHRGLENFKDDTSKGLLAEVRNQLVEQSFSTGKPISREVQAWSNVLDTAKLSPSFHLDSIDVEIANLTAHTSKISIRATANNPEPDEFTLSETISQAYEFERRLLEWRDNLPPSWAPTRLSGSECIPQSVAEASLYQDYCHIYSSISVSTAWNNYRISHIRIRCIILSLLQATISNPLTTSDHLGYSQTSLGTTYNQAFFEIETSRSCISQLADDICASVPFRLGDKINPGRIGDTGIKYPSLPGHEISQTHYLMAPALGPFGLLKPFGVLLSLQEIFGEDVKLRQGQVQWIMDQMGRIVRLYNFGRRWQRES